MQRVACVNRSYCNVVVRPKAAAAKRCLFTCVCVFVHSCLLEIRQWTQQLINVGIKRIVNGQWFEGSCVVELAARWSFFLKEFCRKVCHQHVSKTTISGWLLAWFDRIEIDFLVQGTQCLVEIRFRTGEFAFRATAGITAGDRVVIHLGIIVAAAVVAALRHGR